MADLEKKEGYKVVKGRYVREIERNIKVKVKKPWRHLSKKTVVDADIELSLSEYHYALGKGLVDEAAESPRLLEKK